MFSVEYACFTVNNGDHTAFRDHKDALSRSVGPFRDPVAVALVKNDIVFPDLVGYTVVSRLCKAVLGYWREVLFFDGEYLRWYLFCCPVLFGVSRPFQPGDTVTVEIVDIIQDTVLGEAVLRILDHRFDTPFGFRVRAAAQEDAESGGVQVTLESFRINDVAVVLADSQYLILVIYDLLRPPAKESECLDVCLHKISSRPRVRLPQDILLPGVGEHHPKAVDLLTPAGRGLQADLSHIHLGLPAHRRVIDRFVLPDRIPPGNVILLADGGNVVSKGSFPERQLLQAGPLLDPVIDLGRRHIRILLQTSNNKILMGICLSPSSLRPVFTR